MASNDLRNEFSTQVFHFPTYRIDLVQFVREDGLYLEIMPEPFYRVQLTNELLMPVGFTLRRFACLLDECFEDQETFRFQFETTQKGMRMILSENETGLSLVSIEFEIGTWQI